MCGPLPLVAAGVKAVGQIVGGVTALQQGNYEAKIADRNAAIERENILLERENTTREALNHYRRVAQLKGEQRATAAANGVSTDFGTPADVIDDTSVLSREDADLIYRQGHENIRGRDRSVANFMSEASAARGRGRSALFGSIFGAGSTALGGVSQYRKLKAG